jgi:hypothetical protein
VPIPEKQLETWSHQPVPGPSRDTYAAVKKTLEDTATPFASKDPNIHLQGSYGNDTNVARDSDVDVVCFITGTFASDAVYLPQNNTRNLSGTIQGPRPTPTSSIRRT